MLGTDDGKPLPGYDWVKVGDKVSCTVGATDGDEVGCSVGATDGSELGMYEGTLLAGCVGVKMGDWFGAIDSNDVG